MKPAAFLLLFGLVSTCFPANGQTVAPADKETPSVTSRASGLQKHDGFIPYYWDEKKGAAGGGRGGGGLQKHDGFIPYYWDEKKGAVLFELSSAALKREFLYFTGMGSGIGSPELFADRSSFGGEALCRFRRVGIPSVAIPEN